MAITLRLISSSICLDWQAKSDRPVRAPDASAQIAAEALKRNSSWREAFRCTVPSARRPSPHLNAVVQGRGQIVHEVLGVRGITFADEPIADQLRIGANRGPDIARECGSAFRAWSVLSFVCIRVTTLARAKSRQ